MEGNLRRDFPDLTNTQVAEKAISYGICKDRTRKAIEVQLSRLANSQKNDSTDCEDEQLEFDFQKSVLEAKAEKYESILEATIGTATLWDSNADNPKLKFYIPALYSWLYKNEPEKINARIDALLAEKETK